MTAEEIKELRAKLGLTQEAMARAVGVSYPTILRWESGRFKPCRMALEKLEKLRKAKR
jgi:DNA-binding transcriptional regulator YiaG